jgi:hypothetical protein
LLEVGFHELQLAKGDLVLLDGVYGAVSVLVVVAGQEFMMVVVEHCVGYSEHGCS